jgi:hypothetical protein
MKLLSASLAIALLSAVWFSMLIDRVLYGPPKSEQLVEMQSDANRDWSSRWNLGGKV